MDMIQLQYFVLVAETLNFREAARRLSISQSSISRQIGELEQELDVQLFNRNNRFVSLTEEGVAFLPYAMDILRTTESASFLLKRIQRGAAGHLSVAAVSTSSDILTKCLDVFFQRYPDIVVDVTLNNGREQVLAMSEEKYDFHFSHIDMLPMKNRLDYLITHKDNLVLVVPKGHRLTRKPLDFADLENERFIISMEPGSPLLYEQVLEVCRRHNYSPKIMNRYDKAESVLLAVSAGLGISILPEALSKVFFPNSVDIIAIDDMDTSRTYIAAWPKQLSNPSAHLFLEVVRELFTGEAGG